MREDFDVNYALARLRRWLDGAGDEDEAQQDFEELDHWLSGGGTLPTYWSCAVPQKGDE